MSVRVNLLPEATKQRDRAAQQRAIAALAGVAFLASLGGIYLWSSSQVSAAEQQLAIETATSTELRGEVAELVNFQELADRRDLSQATLIAAMHQEVSVGGLLQDFALVMPPDAQIETLTVQMVPPTTPDETDRTTPVGSFSMNGKTLTSHAPGVERVLVGLDKVVSLSDLYLSASALDDPEGQVASFTLEGQIAPSSRTDRYVDGWPEELR